MKQPNSEEARGERLRAVTYFKRIITPDRLGELLSHDDRFRHKGVVTFEANMVGAGCQS